MQYFNFNGKLYEDNTPVINPNSRALRYGDGLFETLKIVDENIILLDEHFERLWQGMQLLQFDVPKHFTAEKLVQQILQLAQKNKHQQLARVRLSILRGNGGLYDAENHTPNYIIQTWELPAENNLLNSNGLVLGVYNDAKKSCDKFSNLKHNNFLPYLMAALAAKNNKWNDAIVLNNHGNVCDSTIANIFYIKDKFIHTPSLAEGCIAGVTRSFVLNKLQQLGYSVIEGEMLTSNLLTADEVFLTNSIYNIRWVKQIENAVYKNIVTQKIFEKIFATK
jgi:branched-chain amino acid aminotransferase